MHILTNIRISSFSRLVSFILILKRELQFKYMLLYMPCLKPVQLLQVVPE